MAVLRLGCVVSSSVVVFVGLFDQFGQVGVVGEPS